MTGIVFKPNGEPNHFVINGRGLAAFGTLIAILVGLLTIGSVLMGRAKAAGISEQQFAEVRECAAEAKQLALAHEKTLSANGEALSRIQSDVTVIQSDIKTLLRRVR